VQWRTRSTSSGQCTLQGLIAWLSADGVNQAFVADRLQSLPVRVVRPVGKPPYICATAEDGSTDALLALPRF
jgi:hypothetical protein